MDLVTITLGKVTKNMEKEGTLHWKNIFKVDFNYIIIVVVMITIIKQYVIQFLLNVLLVKITVLHNLHSIYKSWVELNS